MDYSVIDIYSKDKFTLRSVARKRQFNFIRYNGRNYDEVVSFIHEASPNTRIIDEQLLTVGDLYSFSGRDFRMKRILTQDLRFVIASNPYLVSENGECIPLALQHQQAVDYLKENRHHKLFSYYDMLSTYKYNPDIGGFIVYNPDHIKGVAIDELPDIYDWYIGGDDNIHKHGDNLKLVYQHTLHIVDVRYSFEQIVERIESLRYRINKKNELQGRTVMFNVSWENYIRRKNLRTSCLDSAHFRYFVDALYNEIYEETKDEKLQKNKFHLAAFSNHPFVKTVGELRNYYGHGRDSYKISDSNRDYSIDRVFLNYLNHNRGPEEPDDFFTLQQRILNDYVAFLERILESVQKKSVITAIICEDDSGNLYCGNVVLPRHYKFLRGCEGTITSYTENDDEQTKTLYPYYCEKMSFVLVNIEGLVQQDSEKTYYANRFIFKDTIAKYVGKKVLIKKIHPFVKKAGKPQRYFGEVIDYSIIDKK